MFVFFFNVSYENYNYLNFYMCFLIVDKPVLLSGFFCVYVFYQLTTFAVLILYYFFYFVLCKRGKIKKAGIPPCASLSFVYLSR